MTPENQSSLNLVTTELIVDQLSGFFTENTNREVEGILFWKPPGNFYFFTLSLEIPGKTKLHPWKFHQIVLNLLEIPRRNHQNPWKFHIIFSW